MQLAPTTFHQNVHLGTRTAAILGIEIVRRNLKLLNGVDTRVDHEAIHVEVVVVDSVEKEVVGAFPGPVDVDAAAVLAGEL